MIFLIIALAITTILAGFFYLKFQKMLQCNKIMAQQFAGESQEKANYRERAEELQEQNSELIRAKAEAETHAKSYFTQLQEMKSELNIKNEEQRQLEALIHQAQQEKSNTEIRLSEIQKRLNDFEKIRQESMENAKAAIFEVGNKLSSNLIQEHKREKEELAKVSEERVNNAQVKFHESFNDILQKVATLNDRVDHSQSSVNLVKNALLSPNGAGALAEITLENLLKSSGLQAGLDYEMQYSVDALAEDRTRLRPDAVIFAPGDNVIIIDSKASKFFVEMEQAGNDELNDKLKATMRMHLKSLAGRDYKDALKNHLVSLKKNTGHTVTVMFLPSEAAIEKLKAIDKEFIFRAAEQDILIAGPVGIMSIVSLIKFNVTQVKQAQNYDIIIEEIKKLLASFSILSDYAGKVGGSIRQLSGNFDKFAGSFNTNLLPKARKLSKMGVEPSSGKKLPDQIERYQVIASTSPTMIEIEAEELEEGVL